MLIRFQGSESLYRQVYRAIRQAILAGELPGGTRLPSTRTLARENGISRNIALWAYDQLIAEGYVEPRTGSGTYVCSSLPETMLRTRTGGKRGARFGEKRKAARLSSYARRVGSVFPERVSGLQAPTQKLRFDFRFGIIHPDEVSLKAWRRAILHHTERPLLDYAPPEGYEPLREVLASYVRKSRGVVCSRDQIVIVNGSQQALDLAARVLVDPGDRVVIEEPHYPGARYAFVGTGATLTPVPVDSQGLDTTAIPPDATDARLVYVTPSHQFPTGAVMPLSRRLRLLQWANQANAHIIEDDYDSEYCYERRPIEAIQALDPDGRTIYVGTLSKALFPALRVGFLVLPSRLVDAFRGAKWLADWHTPTAIQAALSDFIADGHFERHLRRMRRRVASRRIALLEALEENLKDRIETEGMTAGIHLLVWLPGVSRKDFARFMSRAREVDVGLHPVAPYYVKPPRRCGLLLGYASLTEDQIREGVRRIAASLREVV